MNWIEKNLIELISLGVLGLILIFVLYMGYLKKEDEKYSITIKFKQEQLARLKELSKQDFRDVEHTMLMLADQYIEYNNEVKK